MMLGAHDKGACSGSIAQALGDCNGIRKEPVICISGETQNAPPIRGFHPDLPVPR